MTQQQQSVDDGVNATKTTFSMPQVINDMYSNITCDVDNISTIWSQMNDDNDAIKIDGFKFVLNDPKDTDNETLDYVLSKLILHAESLVTNLKTLQSELY